MGTPAAAPQTSTQNTEDRMVGPKSVGPKWGSGNRCPACDKTVYPSEQVFAADRKPWHRQCIKCSVMGCPNELYDRGFFKSPEGHLVCESCNEIMFAPKSYGPPPGMESLEERRAAPRPRRRPGRPSSGRLRP